MHLISVINIKIERKLQQKKIKKIRRELLGKREKIEEIKMMHRDRET